MRKKAPLPVFQKTIEYFPSPSVNIVVYNQEHEFLLIKRSSEPAFGYWWVPGGRILNGETVEQSAQLILSEEVGIQATCVHVSPFYFEEIFPVSEFVKPNLALYPEDIKNIHYMATVVLMECESKQAVTLDNTSCEYGWFKTLPNEHVYLRQYFDAVKPFLGFDFN